MQEADSGGKMAVAEMARTDHVSQNPACKAPGHVRVAVMHSTELFLWGCRALFGSQDWVERCLVARDLDTAAQLVSRYEPHVTLVQVGDVGSAARNAAALRQAHPHGRLLMIAETGRLTLSDARAAGAQGLLDSSLSARNVLDLVQAVAGREAPPAPLPLTQTAGSKRELSARERQVLWHLATGATNREIGRRLVLSPDTIKNHVSRAYRKLGARNRLEAVNRARDLGLLS